MPVRAGPADGPRVPLLISPLPGNSWPPAPSMCTCRQTRYLPCRCLARRVRTDWQRPQRQNQWQIYPQPHAETRQIDRACTRFLQRSLANQRAVSGPDPSQMRPGVRITLYCSTHRRTVGRDELEIRGVVAIDGHSCSQFPVGRTRSALAETGRGQLLIVEPARKGALTQEQRWYIHRAAEIWRLISQHAPPG